MTNRDIFIAFILAASLTTAAGFVFHLGVGLAVAGFWCAAVMAAGILAGRKGDARKTN